MTTSLAWLEVKCQSLCSVPLLTDTIWQRLLVLAHLLHAIVTPSCFFCIKENRLSSAYTEHNAKMTAGFLKLFHLSSNQITGTLQTGSMFLLQHPSHLLEHMLGVGKDQSWLYKLKDQYNYVAKVIGTI